MANAKLVTQRFTQKVKSIAKATMKALEPDKRTAKSRRRPMVYALAADGFVSDPMLLEPVPRARPTKTPTTKTGRRTGKAARKVTKKTSSRRTATAKKRTGARGR